MALIGAAEAVTVAYSGTGAPEQFPQVSFAGTSDWVVFGQNQGRGDYQGGVTFKPGERLAFFQPVGANFLTGTTVLSLADDSKIAIDLGGSQAYRNFVLPDEVDGASMSMSFELFAPNLTFNIYMISQDSIGEFTYKIDNGAASTPFNWQLPTLTSSGQRIGVLTLNVMGAEVGSILNFTMANDFGGATPANGFLGVQAVTASVSAVPETGNAVLMGGLLGSCLMFRKRRQAA